MILYCDVGIYDEALFRKFYTSLIPGGRLVIVDKFGSEKGLSHPSRAHWALLAALSGSAPKERNAEDVRSMLRIVGFKEPSVAELPGVTSRWSIGWTRIVARV